jgi:copper(I)-binding protein
MTPSSGKAFVMTSHGLVQSQRPRIEQVDDMSPRPPRRTRILAAVLPAAHVRARWGRWTGAAALATLVTACGPSQGAENNPPGTNVTVDGIAIRYAHLEDPDAPGTGYREGDDIPFYVWLVNRSGEPASLTGVSSAIATDVSLDGATTPVDLPPGDLVDLGPDGPHFVLADITGQVRGAEFVPVTLTFGDGTEVEILVQAVDVGLIGPTP